MERVVRLNNQISNKEIKKPLNIAITGASGQIGYSLLFMIGQGYMFGPFQPVNITLHCTDRSAKALEGFIMEIQDSLMPAIKSIKGTQDLKECFKNCDIAILMGSKPRVPGLERDHLLKLNTEIMKTQGELLNEVANDNCKVLVVSNPCNTSAYTLSKFMPRFPRKNITCLTRLDQNRAIFQIATKLNVLPEQVKNPIIWGNHSLIVYADIRSAIVTDHPTPGSTTKVTEALSDPEWGRKGFIEAVRDRGGHIIRLRSQTSTASTACAICDHMHEWVLGTPSGAISNMGVISDGSYGVPEGLVFSMPVTCENGEYKIVQGIEIDEFARKQFEINIKELSDEKKIADDALAKLK